jgi:hypothetical protein
MRITRKDLVNQVETISRLIPAPEGMIWRLDIYAPGNENLYKLEVVNRLDGPHPGIGYDPYGDARYNLREMHAFMCGIIQARTADLVYLYERHLQNMADEDRSRKGWEK